MKMKLRAAVGSLLVSAAVAGAAVAPASGQAAVPGQVCHIHAFVSAAWVWNTAGTGVLYALYPGDGFRVVDYAGSDYYLGHGNGRADGHLRRVEIDQASCHW